MEPPNINNPTTLGPSNSPCSNNFLLGGNIIHFNNSQLANISNYSFDGNSLNSINFLNGDNYKRAISYDVIEEVMQYDSYSSYCPDDYYSYKYQLINKRGSYNYVCFPKLSYLSFVTLISDANNAGFFKGIPDNLSGFSFTIPDSTIVPAQAGNSVVGINSSNSYNCQVVDCAKIANGSEHNDNCGNCAGGSTGIEPCRDDTTKATVVPCDSVSNNNGQFLTNIINDIKDSPDYKKFKDSAYSGKNESALSIAKDVGSSTYTTLNFHTSTSAMHVDNPYTLPNHNLTGAGHTHNSSGAISPSPGDIYHLLKGYNENHNFMADFVSSFDSSDWALMITDTSNVSNFLNTYPEDSLTSNGDWDSTRIAFPGQNMSIRKKYINILSYLYNTKHYPFKYLQAYANVFMLSETFNHNSVKMYRNVEGQYKELNVVLTYDNNGNIIDIKITICQ
jgi:hypothetical protein